MVVHACPESGWPGHCADATLESGPKDRRCCTVVVVAELQPAGAARIARFTEPPRRRKDPGGGHDPTPPSGTQEPGRLQVCRRPAGKRASPEQQDGDPRHDQPDTRKLQSSGAFRVSGTRSSIKGRAHGRGGVPPSPLVPVICFGARSSGVLIARSRRFVSVPSVHPPSAGRHSLSSRRCRPAPCARASGGSIPGTETPRRWGIR